MLKECADRVKDMFNLANNSSEISWISQSATVYSCFLCLLIYSFINLMRNNIMWFF